MTLIGSNKLTASTADLTQNIPSPGVASVQILTLHIGRRVKSQILEDFRNSPPNFLQNQNMHGDVAEGGQEADNSGEGMEA